MHWGVWMPFIWVAGSKLGRGNRVLLTALPSFVLLPKWSVPKLAHCSLQLLPYTGTRCFPELQVTASARWRFAAALALKKTLHQHARALCRTWNMGSCYPFATVHVPLIPLSVALEAGHYWKVKSVLEALPFWPEYRTNSLYGTGGGSHGLLLLFLLIAS